MHLEGAHLFDVKLLEVAKFGILLEAIDRLGDSIERRFVATLRFLQVLQISPLDAFICTVAFNHDCVSYLMSTFERGGQISLIRCFSLGSATLRPPAFCSIVARLTAR